MQNTEHLKMLIIKQIEHATDEALLDLIYKLLITENEALQATA